MLAGRKETKTMITDTPELRRLLFIAQQRRWRLVAMPVSMPTGENDAELAVEDDHFHQAHIAYGHATAALLDYLQRMVDT